MFTTYKRKGRKEETVSVFHHLTMVKLHSFQAAENIYGKDKINLKTRNSTPDG